MTAFSVGLQRAALGLVSLALFRALPVLFYLVASRARWRSRLALMFAFGGALALLVHRDPTLAKFLAGIAVAFGYLIGVALLFYKLAPHLSLRALRRGALLLPAAVLCVIVPGFAIEVGLPLGAIAIGWETMLSAHSYAIDTAGQPRSWREYLFFVFVNPTVVFRERGTRIAAPRLDGKAVARVALGLLAMLGHDAILLAMLQLRPAAGYLGFLRTQGLLALALYAAHSGLASLQIGYLRCLGYRLPERYRYPLFATSPQAFWQRWNTWVGRWGYRYVFLPLGRNVARGRAGILAAAVATFAIVGALHDLALYAIRGPGDLPDPRMTLIFIAAALVFPVFNLLARPLKRAPFLCWLLWFHIGLVLLWLTIPVLRDNRLPFERPPHTSRLVATQ